MPRVRDEDVRCLRFMKIPKRNGKFRTVVVPPEIVKKMLRNWVPTVSAAAMIADKHDVMHGFVPGRSPVTNAKEHVGYRYTLSMDLVDFFDRVESYDRRSFNEWAYKMIPPECQLSTKRHAPYGWVNSWEVRRPPQVRCVMQGLPTAPALANLFASSLDNLIVAYLGMSRLLHDFKYTRYADDLTFSSDYLEDMKLIREHVQAVCDKQYLPVNESKTKLMDGNAGRRIITGVAVDDRGVYPTRAVKRRIRAAEHQDRKHQVMGLREWAKLKEPDFRAYKRRIHETMIHRTGYMADGVLERVQGAVAMMEIR
jgi:RNA-directed DNA polymerase